MPNYRGMLHLSEIYSKAFYHFYHLFVCHKQCQIWADEFYFLKIFYSLNLLPNWACSSTPFAYTSYYVSFVFNFQFKGLFLVGHSIRLSFEMQIIANTCYNLVIRDRNTRKYAICFVSFQQAFYRATIKIFCRLTIRGRNLVEW